MFLTFFGINAQNYSANFEGAGETKTVYGSGDVTLSGLSWNMTEGLIGTDAGDFKNGIRSARMRGYGTSSFTMLENKSDGIGTVSFLYRRYSTDAQVAWVVEYSIDNGVSWTQIGDTFTATTSTEAQTFQATVNSIVNGRIRIRTESATGTANRRLNIDDILITDFTENGASPFLSANPSSITGLSYTLGQGPSASETFEISGNNFETTEGNISIEAPSSFELSLDNISFSDDLSVPFLESSLATTTIYTRLKAGLSDGIYNESITLSGGGTVAQMISLEGNVVAPFTIPYINDFRTQANLDAATALGFTYTNGVIFGGTGGGGYTRMPNLSSIITPEFDLTDLDGLEVSFDLTTFGGNSGQVLTVFFSNDNGDTFDQLDSFNVPASYATFTQNIDLTDYTGSTGKIKFEMTAGTNQIRFRDLDISEAEVQSFMPEISVTSCGTTIENTQYERIYATDYDNVTEWMFKIDNGTESFELTRNVDYVHFYDFVPNIAYGVTYQVSVSVKINDEWSGFGPSCPISITANPKTEILYNTCGTTLANIASNITLKSVDLANMYRITVKNMDTDEEVSMDQTSRLFRLGNFSNVAYGTDFEVKAQVSIDGGATFFEANTPCVISTPALAIVAPNLIPASCGITVSKLNEDIYTPWVNDNAIYCFHVSKGGEFVEEKEMPTRRFRLTDLTEGVEMGQTYTLKVRIKLFGTYSDYGTTCDIFTPSVPLAQLSSQRCNSTIPGFTTTLRSVWVNNNVQAYMFAIVDEEMNVISEVERATEDVNLTQFPGFTPQSGTTYRIRVKVRIGNTWGEYGSVCLISTPGQPTPVAKLNNNMSDLDSSLVVYPNPFRDNFSIKFANDAQANIQVYETNGRLVFSKSTKNTTELIIGNDFAKGVYFVLVEQNGKVESFKMIKE